MYGISSYIYQRFTPIPYMDGMGMGDDFMMVHVRVRFGCTIAPDEFGLITSLPKPANKWSYNTPKWGQITPHIAIDKAIYRGPPFISPHEKNMRFWGAHSNQVLYNVMLVHPFLAAKKLGIKTCSFATYPGPGPRLKGFFLKTNHFRKSVPNTAGGERFF